MAGDTLRDISQEAIDDFWGQGDNKPSRRHPKGLNYELEGCMNNRIVEKINESLRPSLQVPV